MALTDSIATERASLGAQETEALAGKQKLLDEAPAREQRHAAEDAQANQGIQQAFDTPIPPREQVAMPAPPDLKKLVDPKEYEGLSYALIGMALVGGAVSKGNWLGVSSALNGALKGYSEGNHEKAQEAMDEFKTKFTAAKEHEAQANKQYEDLFDNKKLTINEKLQQAKVIAAQHGHEDTLAEASAKRYDGTLNQINARKSQLIGTEERAQAVQERISAQTAMHAMRARMPGGAALTDEGAQWVAEYTKVTGTAPSLYGGKAAIFNTLAQQGADPADVAANKGEYAAIGTALRQQTSRAAGIENITASIQKLEPEVVRLAKKVGIAESSLINTPMNALRAKLGDGDLAELRTVLAAVSREYIRATTAPQSQGQLHVAATEMADSLLNSNQSIGQIEGSMRGMNTDIAAGRDAATGIAGELLSRVRNKYKMTPATGGAAAPAQGGASAHPADIDALLQKYGGH